MFHAGPRGPHGRSEPTFNTPWSMSAGRPSPWVSLLLDAERKAWSASSSISAKVVGRAARVNASSTRVAGMLLPQALRLSAAGLCCGGP
eukprot:5142048-Prymnesium_polylepis.3